VRNQGNFNLPVCRQYGHFDLFPHAMTLSAELSLIWVNVSSISYEVFEGAAEDPVGVNSDRRYGLQTEIMD